MRTSWQPAAFLTYGTREQRSAIQRSRTRSPGRPFQPAIGWWGLRQEDAATPIPFVLRCLETRHCRPFQKEAIRCTVTRQPMQDTSGISTGHRSGEQQDLFIIILRTEIIM